MFVHISFFFMRGYALWWCVVASLHSLIDGFGEDTHALNFYFVRFALMCFACLRSFVALLLLLFISLFVVYAHTVAHTSPAHSKPNSFTIYTHQTRSVCTKIHKLSAKHRHTPHVCVSARIPVWVCARPCLYVDVISISSPIQSDTQQKAYTHAKNIVYQQIAWKRTLNNTRRPSVLYRTNERTERKRRRSRAKKKRKRERDIYKLDLSSFGRSCLK